MENIKFKQVSKIVMSSILLLGLANMVSGCVSTQNKQITEGEKMSQKTHTKEDIRAAMDHLIDRATNFDVDALESIYHNDFHTTLVMPNDEVKTYNKQEFIAHFRKQAEDQNRVQLNTWAKWHDFNIIGDSAVSVLTRKHSGMNGEEMYLLCNIELKFEDGRWQVIREAIYLRPLES